MSIFDVIDFETFIIFDFLFLLFENTMISISTFSKMSTSSNSFDMLRVDRLNKERALMLKIDSERSILLLNDSEEFMFSDNSDDSDKLMKIWECVKNETSWILIN